MVVVYTRDEQQRKTFFLPPSLLLHSVGVRLWDLFLFGPWDAFAFFLRFLVSFFWLLFASLLSSCRLRFRLWLRLVFLAVNIVVEVVSFPTLCLALCLAMRWDRCMNGWMDEKEEGFRDIEWVLRFCFFTGIQRRGLFFLSPWDKWTDGTHGFLSLSV